MSPFTTRIRFRVLAIVFLAIVPAVALICYFAAERKRDISREIEGNALLLSRFLANNLERDLSEAESFLRATTRSLKAPDSGEGCPESLGRLLGRGSVYSNLGVADSEGTLRCSAHLLPGAQGLDSLDWFPKLKSSDSMFAGFDLDGRLSEGASIVIVLPFADSGRKGPSMRKYVFTAMDLNWLNKLAEGSHLPKGTAISVTNKQGDAVARYPDPDKWVGKARNDTPRYGDLSETEGVRDAQGIDGIKRVYAYAVVGGKGGLVVNVGLERAALLKPANRLLFKELAALALVALFAVMAAWIGADIFILRQVRALIEATKKLGAGNLQVRTDLPYGDGELGELARAFDEMAETLEWRNAQLKELEVERTDPASLFVDFMEQLPEPFLLLDEQLTIVACNREAIKLMDERQGLAGKPLQNFFLRLPLGDLARLLLAPPDSNGRRVRRRTHLSRSQGDAIPLEISITKAAWSGKSYMLAILTPIPDPTTESR